MLNTVEQEKSFITSGPASGKLSTFRTVIRIKYISLISKFYFHFNSYYFSSPISQSKFSRIRKLCPSCTHFDVQVVPKSYV